MKNLVQLFPHQMSLYIIAAFGLIGLNGVFVYYSLFHPETLSTALSNPISLVFIVEAFLMMGLIAWLTRAAGLIKPGWLVFTIMTIAGSLAFSVPMFLIIHLRKQSQRLSSSQIKNV